jgi:hypothetical protein
MSARPPQQWFDRAREDLQVARLVLQERHFSTAMRSGPLDPNAAQVAKELAEALSKN